MKIKVEREKLLRPLQLVNGVIEKRQTLPVLSNILMRVNGSTLEMTGSDMEVEITARLEVEEATDGEITLPGRKFGDICRMLPEGSVIKIEEEQERAVMRSGRSKYVLAMLPAADYPAIEIAKHVMEVEVAQKVLKGLIDKTQFSMANQDVRYYLNGMLLELGEGKMRAVATDGHRLAVAEAEIPDLGDEKRQVIVPRKGVVELGRLLGDTEDTVKVRVGQNHLVVEVQDAVFVSKLIDGRFPDYDRVIPKLGDKEVTADKVMLKEALVRTAILSNEKFRGIRLNIRDGRLKATVNNPEQEEAEEELEVSYSGSEIVIGFNVAYLVDALNAVSEQSVKIEFSDSNSSCLIYGEGDRSAKYVVMPMRL